MHRVEQRRRASPRRAGPGSRPVTRGRRSSQAMRRRSLLERYPLAQRLSLPCWDLLEPTYPGRWLH